MMLPVARGVHPSHELAEQILCLASTIEPQHRGDVSDCSLAERNGWLGSVGSVSFPFLIIPPFRSMCLSLSATGLRQRLRLRWQILVRSSRADRHRPRQLGNLPERTFATGFQPPLNCFIRLVVPGYQVFHRLRPPDQQVSARSTVTAAFLISTADLIKARELSSFLELASKLTTPLDPPTFHSLSIAASIFEDLQPLLMSNNAPDPNLRPRRPSSAALFQHRPRG